MNSLTHLYCILSIVPVAFSQLFFYTNKWWWWWWWDSSDEW